jgi:ELWxxDGT repeat protein
LLRRLTRRSPSRGKSSRKPGRLCFELLEDRTLLSYTLFAAGNTGGSPPSNIELWRTDGTAKGTVLVKDINRTDKGLASSNPLDLTYIPQMKEWFFSADDGIHGRQPWISNGTAAGTKMIKEMYKIGTVPGNGLDGNSAPYFTYMNGYVYFAANGGPSQGGLELWRTKGTAASTKLVDDIIPGQEGSVPSNLTVVGNQLFFVADDGVHGREVWVTNGTAAGTHLVKDILSGDYSSLPEHLTAVNGKLFFSATDLTYGTELWVSDGTANGTYMVKDINPGPNPNDTSNAYSSKPDWLTSFQNKCYFSANGGGGIALWESDGTAGGTVMVALPGSSPTNLTVMNNTLYFSALEGGGSALYKSDGTTAGTVLVQQINTAVADSHEPTDVHLNPMRFTVVGNQLFFIAGTNYDPNGINENVELWRSDGTASGTYQVKDINPGTGDSSPSKLRAVNGKLVFFAYTPTYGREPWVSDGTAKGTTMLKNINPTMDISHTFGQDSESRGFSYDGYLWEN